MGIAVSQLKPHETERVQTRWRRIVTPIPVPESLPIIERLRAAEPRSMSGMPPVLWDQAEGFVVRDRFGNQWIDLTSSIIVANSGHSHPRILQAIRQALDHKLLTTYAFPQEPRLRLLEKLVALSPIEDSKAILFCAGTEATECAIMLMRRQGRKIHPKKVGILSFEAGYHGPHAGGRFGLRQAESQGMDPARPAEPLPDSLSLWTALALGRCPRRSQRRAGLRAMHRVPGKKRHHPRQNCGLYWRVHPGLGYLADPRRIRPCSRRLGGVNTTS